MLWRSGPEDDAPRIVVEGDSPRVDAQVVVDVSALSGARVESLHGYTHDGVSWRGACVRGPSDRWAPGAEQLLLDRANHLIAARMPSVVERWEPSAIVWDGSAYQQSTGGKGRVDGTEVSYAGRNTLGFYGDKADVILCVVACQQRLGADQCEDALASSTTTGAWAAEPSPGLLVRAIVASVESPLAAALVAIAVSTAAISILIWRRPKEDLSPSDAAGLPKRAATKTGSD